MTSKRQISAPNEAGFLDSHVKIVVFARLDFSSGVQRFHTEIGNKNAVHPIYGNEQYVGVGDFGGIGGEVKETVSGAPVRIDLVLSGIDATLISTALDDNYFRREAEIMIGLEDANGDLLDDPEILFSGYMDKIDMSASSGEASMTLALESRGTNFLNSSDLRVTDEDLQKENSGDLLFEYVYQMVDVQLNWGGKPAPGAYGGAGAGGEDPRDIQLR